MPTKLSSKPLRSRQKPILTISLVNYNTTDLLIRCIKSIYKFTKVISFEIIVVDNNSTDIDTIILNRLFPQVRIISNSKNLYYSIANNQALQVAQGKYFIVLNPDMYLDQDTLSSMVAYMEKHHNIGCIEPLQVDDQNHIIITATTHKHPLVDIIELTFLRRLFSFLQLLPKTQYITRNRNLIWEADVVCGGALMVQTSLMKKLKGFNEELKLYYGENDLCQRVQNAGYKNVHFGKTSIHHTLSSSTNQIGWEKVSKTYARDAYFYYKKYYNVFVAGIISTAIIINLWLAKTFKSIDTVR